MLGQPVTELVDVYAFGILLYELLTGQKPVMGDTVERLFYIILHEPLDLCEAEGDADSRSSLRSLVLALHGEEPGGADPELHADWAGVGRVSSERPEQPDGGDTGRAGSGCRTSADQPRMPSGSRSRRRNSRIHRLRTPPPAPPQVVTPPLAP